MVIAAPPAVRACEPTITPRPDGRRVMGIVAEPIVKGAG